MALLDQLRRNQLAIISLIVALAALGYNTWRNELTEHNRNVRQAGFEMLVHVSELRRVTHLAHYDQDPVGGNPRKGWAEVLVLQDLATLMPEPIRRRTRELAGAWGANWEGLGHNQGSVEAIESAIDATRQDILHELAALD